MKLAILTDYDLNATDIIFQVVNQRFQKGKPLLFTTNEALKQWGRVLHDE